MYLNYHILIYKVFKKKKKDNIRLYMLYIKNRKKKKFFKMTLITLFYFIPN